MTIEIIRGDDRTFKLIFKKGTDIVNITGYTVFFTVKKKLSDPDENAVISKTVTTHTDPTNGETEIVLSNSDTNINPNSYFYDFQLKTDTGLIKSTAKGELIISSDVTRRNE